MGKNFLKNWMKENIKNTESLLKTLAEASIIMRAEFAPIDALIISELEAFAINGKNKVYIASYVSCLLKARKTSNCAEVNFFWHRIEMDALL